MTRNILSFLLVIMIGISGCQNSQKESRQPDRDKPASSQMDKMLQETMAFPASKINDSINTDISFANNTRGKNKLILKYSRTNCWECVEDCIRVLKKFSDSTGFSQSDIIVVSSDYTKRDFRLFHTNNLRDLTVYNLGEDIGLLIEKQNYPYLFVLDSNQVIRDIYLPVKYDDENTLHYLMKTLPKYSFKN